MILNSLCVLCTSTRDSFRYKRLLGSYGLETIHSSICTSSPNYYWCCVDQLSRGGKCSYEGRVEQSLLDHGLPFCVPKQRRSLRAFGIFRRICNKDLFIGRQIGEDSVSADDVICHWDRVLRALDLWPGRETMTEVEEEG